MPGTALQGNPALTVRTWLGQPAEHAEGGGAQALVDVGLGAVLLAHCRPGCKALISAHELARTLRLIRNTTACCQRRLHEAGVIELEARPGVGLAVRWLA